MTKLFFATIQNKLHWAIHQHTAAEIIIERAKAEKINMGLTTWKSEKIRKSDVTIAKNYLTEDELSQLNLLVEQYLAFAENQARRKKPMYMQDWISKLHDILTINENEILKHAGKVTRQLADELAHNEYDKYNKRKQIFEDAKALENLDNELKQLNDKKE